MSQYKLNSRGTFRNTFLSSPGGSGTGFKSKEFVEDDSSGGSDKEEEEEEEEEKEEEEKKSSDKSDAEMDSASEKSD